ncbi:MAG: hypothetical protein DWQ37_18485 [Planctomycetota bacterium]|nr:MAG: hypothetical protein DWQ37_18485 [Planctomycetota bacterium]
MSTTRRSLAACAGLLFGTLAACTHSAPAQAADQRPVSAFSQKATWTIPSVEQVREQAFEWLATAGVDDEPRALAEALWESAPVDGNAAHVLDLVGATLAAVDPRADELVTFCSRPHSKDELPEVAWLHDGQTPAFESNNLRLLVGRWLVQNRLYDEAGEQLSGLKTDQVVDPAALLFYQAVVEHRTLKRDEALASIARLLENEDDIPKRYASLARLMQADIEDLKEDSLDHIARRMEDIERRLDLGRSGPKVREVEDGVIASLDKLIDEMEKQQQAAAAAAAAARGQGGGSQPMPIQPLPDSMPMGGKGEGKVADKPIGNKSGWGDLPPRERQEALQQIGKEFPAHYRDMVEQYFRKLASESENPPE